MPEDLIDDLLQETALRLLRIWDRVDRGTVWALAQTIVSNLVKDEMRRAARRPTSALTEDVAPTRNLDDDIVVRIELRRVQKALGALSPADRGILLAEWGQPGGDVGTSPAALKMARSRARKRLRVALERIAAVVPPAWRARGVGVFNHPGVAALGDSLSRIAVAAAAGLAFLVAPDAGSLGGVPEPVAAAATAAPAGAEEGISNFARISPQALGVRKELPGTPFRRASQPLGTSSGGDALGPKDDDDLNENFGPVRNGDDGIHIGEPQNGLGPYGVDKGAETSVGEHDASGRAAARYDGPECEGELVIGRPSTYECDAGEMEAEAEAERDGKRHRVRTGTRP